MAWSRSAARGVARGVRVPREDEEVGSFAGQLFAEDGEGGGAAGVEQAQAAAAGPPDGLPAAIVQVFLAGQEHIRAEEGGEEFGFASAVGPDEHEARRPLHEEEGLDGADLAQDRVLQRLREPMDEAFEFFVKWQKGRELHERRGRGKIDRVAIGAIAAWVFGAGAGS